MPNICELFHANVFIYLYIHFTFWKDVGLSVNGAYFYYHWVELKLEAIVEIIINNFYFLIFFFCII